MSSLKSATFLRRLRALALSAVMLMPAIANAAQGCGISGLLNILDSTTKALVSGLLQLNCTATAQTIPFGNFNPVSGPALQINGQISVSCTFSLLSGLISLPPILVCYDIALSKGGGSYASRRMNNGANTLNYSIYTSSGLNTVWGDGTNGTSVVSDSYLLSLGSGVKTYPTYGSLVAPQTSAPLGYNDSISVTVSY